MQDRDRSDDEMKILRFLFVIDLSQIKIEILFEYFSISLFRKYLLKNQPRSRQFFFYKRSDERTKVWT